MGALAAVGDEISGVVSFFSAVWNADETIDQAKEFINYAKDRIGDGGWGDFLMEIAEGMIPPGCVERGWDYCAGYVVTTLVLSAASGGIAKLLSKAETVLDATPNVPTKNKTDSDSGSGEEVFRGMREDGELPEIGQSARTLGARPDVDVLVGPDNLVHPNTGGVSVSPGSPANLPSHRRPPSHGGTGKDPVWCLNICDLPDGLQYRPDPENPTGHGFLEPAFPMTFDRYQSLLSSTQSSWSRVS